MTIAKCDAPIVIDTKSVNDTWCVYEHQACLKPGDPPSVILIGACRLHDVYKMLDGRTNSEWSRMFASGGSLLLRIVATTTDKAEAYRHAQALVRDTSPRPHCNLHGYSVRGGRKAVICLNNNQLYRTQRDAATDLGVNPSSLSRHLAGELEHANGLKFAFAPDRAEIASPE